MPQLTLLYLRYSVLQLSNGLNSRVNSSLHVGKCYAHLIKIHIN